MHTFEPDPFQPDFLPPVTIEILDEAKQLVDDGRLSVMRAEAKRDGAEGPTHVVYAAYVGVQRLRLHWRQGRLDDLQQQYDSEHS